jgi:hypothetical protein
MAIATITPAIERTSMLIALKSTCVPMIAKNNGQRLSAVCQHLRTPA